MCFKLVCVCLCVAAAVAQGADHIVQQERHGAHIVVRYASGRVATNDLFLAMNPDVVRDMQRRQEEKEIISALRRVVDDTRTNIVETSGLTDAQIAGLYLMQMSKPVQPLLASAPTNTIEFAIGAGIRHDLNDKED